jgi:hypothetical protein
MSITRFCGMSAALITALAIGATAGPAVAAPAPAPKQELTQANAAQLLPPGYTKIGNDYIYDGGKVIVTPTPASTTGFAAAGLPCPDPYLCLYRDTDWNGTRWLFADHTWQNLAPYGASDQVSSWSNHEGRTATLGWNSIAQGMAPYLGLGVGHASSMGGWNDQASSVLP